MKPKTSSQGEPTLSQFSETLYRVTHEGDSFMVALLPERIAVYGASGHQFFLNNGNLPPSRLHEVFKSPEAYMERALLHKETSTDQTKFLAAVDRLLSEKLIDAHSKRQLREFILKCDCPPRRIKEKLKAMGYGHILSKLDFERYPDELTTTIKAMEKFVNVTRGKAEVPLQVESRRSRARADVQAAPHRGTTRSS